MNRDRWMHIEEILAVAHDLSGHDRSAFLDNACAGDAALRAEIEALLIEHDREGVLDTAPPWIAPAVHEAGEAHETIGPYRILRVIGRGGMGQVWLAEREAPGFRLKVAIKVMRRGLDTDDLVARFRNERQILARLNHPNIARLFDVGATEQGLPYFVMEYVDGVPLLEYCDRARLPVHERIRLFRTVCAAVHHAHRNLIVHRDIKPSNILVATDGSPKLLDFGIAKILAASEDDDAQPLTRADLRLLTPEHAAPEQIRGEAVTTACDVYALGILLYQLLAGRHPHARATADRAQLELSVLDRDPPPPSTTVSGDALEIAAARRSTPAQLRRRLAGDLDTIVLEALRREPDARYASALGFSDDLERHLAGLPVRARPATARYRLRKFVARNRLPVAGAVALFLVLSASTGITLHQSARIRQESARVARERDKALEVRSFLLETFGTSGPDQATGDTVTARQLLDRRAATLDAAYANDDELRAEMLNVLAEGYEKLGLLDQAEPLAREALRIRRELFGPQHPDVAVSMNVLGWLLRQRGDLDRAESLLRDAVTLLRRAFRDGDPRLARALNDFALVHEARAHLDTAAALLRESIEMRRRVLGEEHTGVAIATSNLAAVLYRAGDLEGAAREGEAALALFRRALGPDHQRTLIVQTNLATTLSASGNHGAAAEQHRDILERRRRLFGVRHPSVAQSLTLLSSALYFLNRPAESEPLLREALSIQKEAGVRSEDIVTTLRVLGDVQNRSGDYASALASYRDALSITRESLGDEHATVALLLSRTAAPHASLGSPHLAERAHRDAIDLSSRALGPNHAWTLEMRFAFATFLHRQGRRADTESQLRQIERALDAAGAPSDSPLRVRVQNARAPGS